jgi:hypothetical protein
VVAIGTLVVIAAVAAAVLRTVVPRYHVTFQTAGWQEARLAAEAGVDLALERLNKNVPDPTHISTDWTGWRANATTAATGPYMSRANGTQPLVGNSLVASRPIFLDNVNVSPESGLPAAADIQLTALYPTSDSAPSNLWFRIRSMGVAAVPGPPRSAMDRMDTSLRRLNLRTPMRSTMQANDVLVPTLIPYPNASRVVQVIAQPIRPFAKAIITSGDLILGHSDGWQVNSFDSRDPNKSAPGGLYPGDDSSKVQKNGDIASNKKNPDISPYGALIMANGAEVLGAVSTNGGDNPATKGIYENVSDVSRIDTARIDSQYDDPLTPVPIPTVTSWRNNPNYTMGNPFTASGDPNVEFYYRITTANAPLTGFRVREGTGRITIFIDGDWDIGSGGGAMVEIPPGVKATVYVKGNILLGNGLVNTTAASSKIAGDLLIYGTGEARPDGTFPKLDASGNPHIAAAFYGPQYDVLLSGTAEWYGAVASRSFKISGGGSGGFHYDEALGLSGFIKRFVISSYFEDSRQ